MNKKRTIVTIIGVVLSTALMVGIGLLFSSVRDNDIKSIILDNGAQHLIINDIESKYYNTLKNNVEVRKIYYTESLGFAKINSSEEYKPYVYVLEAKKEILDNLRLLKGRLPQNENEIVIPTHIKGAGDVIYNIGDYVTFNIGKRVIDKNGNKIEINGVTEYQKGEYLTDTKVKTYKVVGIVSRNSLEPYLSPGYFIYSKSNKIRENVKLNAFIEFKDIKKTYKTGEKFRKIAHIEDKNQLTYNSPLLHMYGTSKYNNVTFSMSGIIILILSLISIGCIIVIYNSFAISVMERKKQFGLFSSIGATKKQLRKTVFFESFIIGTIGITIGIFSAILGISIVLEITNKLIPDMFLFSLELSIYPLFIIIPIIFMIVVIILSAYIPAVKASYITPIEVIRQNDDIKIKKEKLKTPKNFKKIFKIEGEIALKNIKRNRKKYKITIISLFISIVLFISFSSLLEYGINVSNNLTNLPKFDRLVTVNSNKEKEEDLEKLFKNIKAYEGVNEVILLKKLDYMSDGCKNICTKETKNLIKKNNIDINKFNVTLVGLDENSDSKIRKKYKQNKDSYIVLNGYKNIVYSNNNRVVKNLEVLNKTKKINLYSTYQRNQKITIDNLSYINDTPMGFENESSYYNVAIIVPTSDINKFIEKDKVYRNNIVIKGNENKNLDKYLKDLETDNKFGYLGYSNLLEESKIIKNMFIVMKILLYGFISLITLIGVTSVFNTINTCISLRRKEFAMLRSVGLTPEGFNRILYFESLFFGLKSLLYGIPVAILITFIIGSILNGIVTMEFLFPIKSIILSIIGVFIIVFLSMIYASRRIKKENILEALREENI